MRGVNPVAAIMVSALLFMAGCDTSVERAERHYKSGLEYLEAGDVDRALVEFRNVFKLNGQHHDARSAYARAERARGNFGESYSQYLRLVEQYPDDLEALTALAEMASDNAQWGEAEKYVTLALAKVPDDVNLKTVKILTDYGQAIENDAADKAAESVDEAQELRKVAPENLRLYKVVIDDLIRAQALTDALEELNRAIKTAPTERIFYAQRLSVNAALGDDAAVERGLIEMAELFEDAPEMRDALLRWYLSRAELDKAEAYLRAEVAKRPDSDDAVTSLIRFLGEYRSADAAVAELDKAIAAGKSVNVFRAARAGFIFDRGDKEGAIAEMQDILKSATAPDEIQKIKVGLARMQMAVGNNVASRALVEDILSKDSGQVDAVKLKATWLILDDEVGDAITLLRDAIDQNPRDSALMIILAQAYERDGNRDLMREMLSRAVEASGRAPNETLQYAQVLAMEGKLVAAESLLIDSLRLSPANANLLIPLGQIYSELKDWPRADAVVRELEALKDDKLQGTIAALRTAILEGQKKSEEATSYLEQLAAGDNAGLDAKIAVLKNHLANGRTTEAKAYANQMLKAQPDDPNVRFVVGSVFSATGDIAEAEKLLREVAASEPTREDVWMTLFRTLASDPARAADAEAVVEEGLTKVPGSATLSWAKAGLLEGKGDIEGAIAIYESLYSENSTNPIVANNLASLLSSYHTDPESLQRAELIAKRLRGSTVPAYQDTYGWIAYKTGKYDEALGELEKAAASMVDDPQVQYHLAMTYLALGQNKSAAEKFVATLALLAEGDSRDFAISAQNELEKLKAAGFAE
ncbi:MAG: tetratricopeptide repeat protein [Paracoccaceae bacterium]